MASDKIDKTRTFFCRQFLFQPCLLKSKYVKWLGLNIDNCLSGESIDNSLVSEVKSRLKFLYRHVWFLDCKNANKVSELVRKCHFAKWFMQSLNVIHVLMCEENTK